jgi:hypothetical protein
LKIENTMKKLSAILCLLSALALTNGCAVFNKSATQDEKVAQVGALCYAAASIGTEIALEENPEYRPQLETAYTALNQLVESKAVTGELLRSIIASLPVDQLKSKDAVIAIRGATIIYDATVGSRVSIEQQPYVLIAATRIRDGMKVALGK